MRADPPIEPLPAPTFSFDLASPKVVIGMVRGDMLLKPAAPNLNIELEGWALGLGLFDDDVDAISIGNATHPPDATFALLFSVDRDTVGVAPPDPGLVALGLPYNVLDQAVRGHAAGDEFMSTSLFSLDQNIAVTAAVLPLNNVLLRNNFDEGGTDFVADPETSADTIVVNELQDNVDALSVAFVTTDLVYFSVSKDSPSLTGLHGRPFPSGADIFVRTPGQLREKNDERSGADRDERASHSGAGPCEAECCQLANGLYADCRSQGGSVDDCAAAAHGSLNTCLQQVCGVAPPSPPGLFASALDLGLRQGDDIDGLVVFDTNADGIFNGTDQVIFSLTRNSPSLATLPGASTAGAGADVFRMAPDLQEPVLLASAASLGLGHEQDDIDALDFVLCDDTELLAATYGIRAQPSIPAVSSWGLAVMFLLMLIAGTIVGSQRKPSAT
ncbi:MAG: hypothetical protein V1790_11360 [Planctomycetota bacterium]